MAQTLDSLKGQFLIATPDMTDERFAGTVIYLVAHGEDGAMGLVVNQPMPDMHLSDILDEIDMGENADSIRISPNLLKQDVLRGGPVDSSRGFVLHTSDYFRDGNSYLVEDNICLTATLDVLRAIADGSGPEKSLLALGYCGWGAGQLENELKQNGWLTAPRSNDLLFSVPIAKRYDKALATLGINRANLSPSSGSA
ncbi:YqgE/AlgH family protein [Pelagibacterium lentulum]|uniref:UPF0301 protein GCM10011499_27880 n=1 Tax=Pelagibacterium lentulum TaxID=2029865 RepID=A0A916RHF9_9HYPH|nr:YqgE/AlgH family protein [Pelagibacterium lentulum]GGA56166.1 UPF0301 protein [Pelagibacterium lentulum]